MKLFLELFIYVATVQNPVLPNKSKHGFGKNFRKMRGY